MLCPLTALSVWLAVTPCAQDAAGPQGPRTTLDVVPLQAVCGWRGGLVPPPWGSMLTWVDPGNRPDLLGTMESGRTIDPDQARDLLQNLHTPAIDADRLHIQLQDDGLFVFGDAAEVASVRDQVQELSAVMLRPLQVEVALWEAGPDTPPAVLGPAQWQQWFGRREPLWRSEAETQSARPVALDQQRWIRYVRTINVEVAQKASISQPVTDTFCDGGRVIVTPHALLGGDDLVLHVQFGVAHLREQVRTLSTGVAGQGVVDLPVLETIYGTCSGRIVNGGGLAVTLRGLTSGGGQNVLTVRVTGRTPPGSPTLSGVAVLPCSALTSAALLQRLSPPSPYPNIGDAESGAVDAQEIGSGFGYVQGDLLLDMLHSSLGEVGADTRLFQAGGHLVVVGNDTVRNRVEDILRGLQDRMLHTVTVRHRGSLAGVDGEAARLHELVLPTLLGREATVSRVLETNCLRDLFVEIAQEASIHVPRVEALQIGSWLRVRTVPQGAQLHVQLLAQCSSAALPQVRQAVPTGGNLTPTDVGSVRTQHDGPAANGQALLHGDGPIVLVDGRPMRSTLDTVLTW